MAEVSGPHDRDPHHHGSHEHGSHDHGPRATGSSGLDPRDSDARNEATPGRTRSRWRPAASSVRPNTDYRAPGSVGGRAFAPTDHLATEAVAAFVDGELRMNAYLRAARHITACPECAAEVEAHTAARSALRRCADITMPSDLLGQLAQIPTREIDMRSALDRAREQDRLEHGRRDQDSAREQAQHDAPTGPRRSARGPLSAPGFPVHRLNRWRDR